MFKLLFRLWYQSYEKYLEGECCDDIDLSLCEWMVPLPGGFHIEKQGMIPILKFILAISGFEETAEFTGLSKKHQKNILNWASTEKIGAISHNLWWR